MFSKVNICFDAKYPLSKKKAKVYQVLKTVLDFSVALVYDQDLRVYWTWGSFFQRLEMHNGVP